MCDLILHHYPESWFSEEIRLVPSRLIQRLCRDSPVFRQAASEAPP